MLAKDRRRLLEHRAHALAHLFVGLRDAEVEVEVASARRDPRKAPAQPSLVCLELRERRAGDVEHRRFTRCRCGSTPLTASALDEQVGQPASYGGPNMKW